MRTIRKNFLANVLMLLHFLWGGWILGGTALAVIGYFTNFPIIWLIYIFTITVNGAIAFFLKYCPLTIVEKGARLNSKNSNEPTEAFSHYWVRRVTGISIPPYSIRLLFIILYLLNFLSYMYWIR